MKRFLLVTTIGVAIMVIVVSLIIVRVSRFGLATADSAFLAMLPARDLLIDEGAFPATWMAGSCLPDCSRREGEQHALRSFYQKAYKPGHVIQEVYRFANRTAAQAKFQRYREVDYRERQSPNTQFVPPPEITYRSPIADEYYLGCGLDEVPACRAIMRYGNYFVSFYFDLDGGQGDGLRLTDIEPIIRALDQQVRVRLSIPAAK